MGTCFQSGRGERQCPPRGERNGTATRISSTNGKRCERDFLTSFHSCYRGNTRARGRNISCYSCAMIIRDLRNSLQDCPGSSLSVSLLRSSVGEGRALDRTRRADLACRHPYVGTLDCHSVIASCILCTLSLRRDETWLLECLVHCDASAGVDRVSQRALIAGSLRSSGLRDRLSVFVFPLPNHSRILRHAFRNTIDLRLIIFIMQTWHSAERTYTGISLLCILNSSLFAA